MLIKLAAFFSTTTDYQLGVERERTVSIKGLNDKQIYVITGMIDVIREK